MELAYCGIDVACAKKKRLPISVSVIRDGALVPLPLRQAGYPEPPRGAGNVGTLDDSWLDAFANEAATYLRAIEARLGISIARIALDAPSDAKRSERSRRLAEKALDDRGISCFSTPSESEFAIIKSRVREHLALGGSESKLPHANQLWMLVGFALFRRLRTDWECLEVYPQATAAVIGAAAVHKSSREGITAQLRAGQKHTGWPLSASDDATVLTDTGFGRLHDSLDAYLAAWVASLPPGRREALGEPPDDVIWIPQVARSTW